MINDTELRLSFWRDGSTKSERLAAALLTLSGYREIDPQSPLGGPDGKKDILCVKGGLTWVGAVYFAIGPKRFTDVKKKFNLDLIGAPQGPEGFAFVTNQSLSPKQRSALEELAEDAGKRAEIFHLQRLVNLLDSASGYGARIRFLEIPMTPEEQLSWVDETNSQMARALSSNTGEVRALRASIERLGQGQAHVARTLGFNIPASALTLDLIALTNFAKDDDFELVSLRLTPELVLLFHRITCFDLPGRAAGILRNKEVWLGDVSGRRVDHVQPPPPDEVKTGLQALCSQWVEAFPNLRTRDQKLTAVAKFHADFLLLHPFLDGNGRTGTSILMQQCLDLFGTADMTLLNKGADYFQALREADGGDLSRLKSLIEPVTAV